MPASSPTFELCLTGASEPHQFTAYVPGPDGTRAAEQSFPWRTDSTALALDLGALARAAISGQPPENELHVAFGRRLHQAVLDGNVGELWQTRRAAAPRQPLSLALRVDPESAQPLLNLPWEYLHDGQDFLALNWRTPLSRLPWGLSPLSLPRLEEPLRLLVQISAPHGLGPSQVLNVRHEEDLILGALSDARRAGQVEVRFAPDGSPRTLERLLREFDPHALHFVGHGVFDRTMDKGILLMEGPNGAQQHVPNQAFAQLLARRGRSLRFCFLSACQTAVAPRNEGYAGLGRMLLEAGLGAAVAMQYSVLNRSAMAFGGAFYRALSEGEAIDAALTEARGALARESANGVDFSTPVLYQADAGCLRVEVPPGARRAPGATLDLTGLTPALRFVGRSAELRELEAGLDPRRGPWRAAVVHGLGGMGKTALATRLAERMSDRFCGTKALRMSPTTTAQDVLDRISAYLLVHAVQLGEAGLDTQWVSQFEGAKAAPLPLESKAAALIAILRSVPLLLILDNYEAVLEAGQVVSRAGHRDAPTTPSNEETRDHRGSGIPMPRSSPPHTAEPSQKPENITAGIDPDLATLVGLLVAGVDGPSRFLFTSRVDFHPEDPERQAAAVGHLALSEMGFRDAAYLMETLPPLDALPVAVVDEARPGLPPAPRATSKRDVYQRLGGHPYTLALFARHAQRASVAEVLFDLEPLEGELVAFSLLDRAVQALPARAGTLLRRAAIYDEPVPDTGLAFLLGDEQDAMPEVGAEVQALLGWGLLFCPPGEAAYAVPTPVRRWARTGMSEGEKGRLLRRAAEFCWALGLESHDLADLLQARHYLFQAGEYEQADEITQAASEKLLRWGQIELLLRLLNESVRTLSETSRAVALGNLAIVYQRLGEMQAARGIYERVLAEFESEGALHQVAAVLHQLGVLHQDQGKYGPARERYEESLAIKQELGNRAGVAISLHQLGNLHYLQGKYGPARERYEEALAISQELDDRAGVARSLYQLEVLHERQGEYGPARELCKASLSISQELGDRAGVATSLHQLGNLNYLQGVYGPAREHYEASLAIKQELGDRAGVATSLYQLGMLHQRQGEYGPARERCEASLAIKRELGDRAGVATSLCQLGILHQLQGEYERARGLQERSLMIRQEIGDQYGIGICLHQLGLLHEQQGEYDPARECYEASLTILQELGDQAGVAGSLHQLGMLHQRQGEYGSARERYEEALAIRQELGDRAGLARSLYQLGMLHQDQGVYGPAREHCDAALAIFEKLGDQAGVAGSLHQLGMLHGQQGEYGPARERYEESLSILQELGDRAGVAISLHQLGNLHYLQGKYGPARECYEESLSIAQELGNRAGVASSLYQLGVVCAAAGAHAQAVQHAAQAFVILRQLGSPDAKIAGRTLARLSTTMGEQAFEAAWQSALGEMKT